MITRVISRSISRPIGRAVGGSPVEFSPLSLFAAGEQGLWYDPSDLSTLFQDAAGTVPVTAAGQPVGVILDKRLGLVPSGELVSNGDFSQGAAGWTLGSGWSIGSGVASKAAGVNADLTSSLAAVVGKTYKITYTATVTAGNMSFRIGSTTGPAHTVSGTFTAYLTATTTSPLAVNGNSAFVGAVDNISVRELPGNHASQVTAGSKPILRNSGGLWYLEFDGVDDFLVTAAINFTATDKMSVFAGFRKLSDAAYEVVAELSASVNTNNGAFLLVLPTPGTIKSDVQFKAIGSTQSTVTTTGLPAPISLVASMDASISADLTRLRVNGGGYVASNGDLGTGNLGNYPLYIGRRAGTSLPFTGYLYGLIVRGALTDAAGITNTEKYMGVKSGVPL